MKLDIWRKLTKDQGLPNFGVEHVEGRADLRHLHIQEPRLTQKTLTADVIALEGITEIRGVKWQSIDFSSSHLPGLRLLNCDITDCVFDECALRDLRAWGTNFSNVHFRSAELRGAVLGGVLNGKRNTFKDVDFSFADLRKTIYVSADFLGCRFNNTKLEKVDFQSSTFENCSFEGELREVIFYSQGFKGDNFPRNKMKNVDFSRAQLRMVEFRRLELEDVHFPKDEDHILIANPTTSLEKIAVFFRSRSDPGSKRIAAGLEHKRKWLGPKQRVEVFNKADIFDIAGEEGLKNFIEMVKGCSGDQ